jgi:hypothetical protein
VLGQRQSKHSTHGQDCWTTGEAEIVALTK